MERRAFIAGLASLSACGWPGGPDADASPLPGPSGRPQCALPPHRGMNHAHLHRKGIGYGTDASRRQLDALAEMGVRQVFLTPFAYMPDLQSPRILDGQDPTLTRADLLREAHNARAAGLSVCLKPHIWGKGFWGGAQGRQDIAPGDWGAWFDAYGAWMEGQARLAEEMEATLLCVGLEYTRATTDNPGAWATVAARCRQHYTGALTYAANWWAEVDAFQDWAAFDLIGVNAYWPLSDAADPTVDQLVAGWDTARKRLARLSAKHQRPVLITEWGLRARRGAAKEPWNQKGGSGEDPALQARAVEALLRAFCGEPWFAGVYWWKWFTDRDNAENDPYSLMGSPAEAVIRSWWADP